MKISSVLLALILGLITLPAAGAEEEQEKLVPATLDELKSAVAGVLEEFEVPAVGIALVDQDGPLWVGSLGKANMESAVDADEETMYRIGSTSKMFVALSVLQLVEQGRLSLDDRVADLAPEIEFENRWEDSDPVRVAHLLEHTTGWDDIHLPEYAHNDPTPATLKEGLDYHPHSRITRWKPGTRFSYCNAGPPVAAYIVQKITGQDFETYVQENFFDPMGMQTMTYRLNSDMTEHGATLYNNGNQPQDYWHIIMRPSGSINASPADMAKFVQFYLDRGRVDGVPLVSEASLQRMERAETTSGARAGLEVGYGLHNYSTAHEQFVFRAHNGGVNGGLTELAYLPQAGVGHAIMINSGDGEAMREIIRLVRAFETRNLVPPVVETQDEVTDKHRSIEGYYYPINPRQQISFFMDRILQVQRLEFREGRLALLRSVLDDEPDWYLPVDADHYRSAETGLVSLVSANDPQAGAVIHRGTQVLKPIGAVQVFTQFGVAALWGLFIATSILFFPVWGVRRLRGKIPSGAAIRIRMWPFLAALSVVVFIGMFVIGFRDPFNLLGTPNIVSVTILVSTLTFALFTLMGLSCAWGARRLPINRVAYWHSATGSVLHLVVGIYLLFHGIIGLMTWA